jgi:N-formylglutamate amidohydrolase
MPYTTNPTTKIKKIFRYTKKNTPTDLTVEEFCELLEKRYNVGIIVHYGRLQDHEHTLEVWRINRNNYMNVLCYIEVPVRNFKGHIDT